MKPSEDLIQKVYEFAFDVVYRKKNERLRKRILNKYKEGSYKVIKRFKENDVGWHQLIVMSDLLELKPKVVLQNEKIISDG